MNFSVRVCITLILFTNFKNFQVAAVDQERQKILGYFKLVINACLPHQQHRAIKNYGNECAHDDTKDIVDLARQVKEAIAPYDLQWDPECVKTIRTQTQKVIEAVTGCDWANVRAQRCQQEPNNAAIWKTRLDRQRKSTCHYVKEIYIQALPIEVPGEPEPLSTEDMFAGQC